ncbi:MAG: RNA polymerase sigma factor [Pyrinomonadaceae bacterium]
MALLAFQTQQNADVSILQRIAGEDKRAVEECLNKYGNLVWSMALNFTNSREDAEDAVQDIFIDIWKYAGRFDAAKSAEVSFIALIARRRLIDLLRKTNRQPKTLFSEEVLENYPDETYKKLQTQIEVKQAFRHLDRLNPQQRKVVQMAVYGGMSQSEIAETIGLPLGTVKSIIRRGFQKIREAIPIENDNSRFLAAG